MVPADIHDYFAASAGVAGALIGLLFVAISVSTERLAKTGGAGQVHRIRAYAAEVAFTDALAVSLFALIPGEQIGMASLVVSIVGLLFVAAALLSLIRTYSRGRSLSLSRPLSLSRLRQVPWTTTRNAVFLIGLAVTFSYQLTSGIDLLQRPGDANSVETIAQMVAVCFLIGVAQAWELIGGPSIGIAHEVVALVHRQDTAAADPAENPGGAAGDAAGSKEH